MAAKLVEVVLECPRPMSANEFEQWERNNRADDMILLQNYNPVGEEPAVLWRVQYLSGDAIDAAMLL
jgi:hypothetical protein